MHPKMICQPIKALDGSTLKRKMGAINDHLGRGA